MKNIWILLQVGSIPFVYILAKLLRIRVIHQNSLPPQKGCLIISNHESKLDPFFILYACGMKRLRMNIPFQFPALNEYVDKKIIGTIMKLFGTFPIGLTIEGRARGLFYIREVLEKKGGIVIFPEAQLVKKGEHRFEDFQKGYTYLITGNTEVILAKLENFHSLSQDFFSNIRPKITFNTIKTGTPKEEALLIIQKFYS